MFLKSALIRCVCDQVKTNIKNMVVKIYKKIYVNYYKIENNKCLTKNEWNTFCNENDEKFLLQNWTNLLPRMWIMNKKIFDKTIQSFKVLPETNTSLIHVLYNITSIAELHRKVYP